MRLGLIIPFITNLFLSVLPAPASYVWPVYFYGLLLHVWSFSPALSPFSIFYIPTKQTFLLYFRTSFSTALSFTPIKKNVYWFLNVIYFIFTHLFLYLISVMVSFGRSDQPTRFSSVCSSGSHWLLFKSLGLFYLYADDAQIYTSSSSLLLLIRYP